MNAIPDLNTSSRSRRFFRWLFSRRIQRRLLLAIAALTTLLAIVYARVNVHGKSEWQNYKRDMTAKGELLDWSAYVPAPVPDDQNIFKAPKMAEWFGDDRGLLEKPLDRPISSTFAGRLANPDSTVEITTASKAAEYLAWSEQFQADFDTLRAALKRPYARIAADYSKPLSITFPNVSTLNAVVKTLVQRARCHLLLGQPEKAWQELTLLHDLRRMVEGQGKFITTEGDWIRRETARHSLVVIARGIELHAWQEPQLAALQQQLKESDFIALHVEALKCGRALIASSFESGPAQFNAAFTASGETFWARVKKHPEFLVMRLAPRGAMYARATGVSQSFQNWINALQPADGILRPATVSGAFAKWKRALDGLPVLLRTQTLVNEGQIACALERYRLAKGNYPAALADLAPKFIESLPRDLINGQPLIYRRTNGGEFTLYSVGWNETDDNGTSVFSSARPETFGQGDWVWSDASKIVSNP